MQPVRKLMFSARAMVQRKRHAGAVLALAGLAGLVPAMADAAPKAANVPMLVMGDRVSADSVTGTLIAPGVLCPQFRIDGGEEISLEGLPAAVAMQPGDRLLLTGQFLRASRCMQGRGFHVISLTVAQPAPDD